MRKLVSLMLALMMMLGMMLPAMAEDPYMIDCYWVGNGDNAAVREGVEKAINEYIEPLIGANITFHIVGWDDWTDKAVNALQSGEKMDMIFTADWREYMVEVTGGLLLELDELVADYGAGITSTLPKTFLDGVRVNGKLYGIPTNKELCVPEGFIVNATAAKEIGWDLENHGIVTTADLEPWLKAYKDKYPNNYPYLMDGAAGRWTDEPWCPDWIGVANNCVAMKMAKEADGTFDETIYNIFATEEQKAHIELMYKWGEAGYINPENALSTFDYNGTFGRGEFLVFCNPLKGNNIKGAEMYAANKTVDFEYDEITMQPKYVVTTHAGGSMFGIPVTSKNPAKAMQFINLMHCDEKLVNLMLFGAEGVNYTKANETQVELIADANWYGVHGGAWTVGNTKLQYVLTSEDPQKNALLQSYADDAIATASLGFRFVKDPVADQIAAITTVCEEYAPALMCGTVDPADPDLGLDAFNAALEDAGMAELIAEVQVQYDAWKKAQK